ncbi:MAG TPA: hypothetical protein PKE04_15015, partial [Clostridia bacterium]|nr:hypothetical protein [Clostridia bacterium]
ALAAQFPEVEAQVLLPPMRVASAPSDAKKSLGALDAFIFSIRAMEENNDRKEARDFCSPLGAGREA